MSKFEYVPGTPEEKAAFAVELEIEKIQRWHKYIGPKSTLAQKWEEANQLWSKVRSQRNGN